MAIRATEASTGLRTIIAGVVCDDCARLKAEVERLRAQLAAARKIIKVVKAFRKAGHGLRAVELYKRVCSALDEAAAKEGEHA